MVDSMMGDESGSFLLLSRPVHSSSSWKKQDQITGKSVGKVAKNAAGPKDLSILTIPRIRVATPQ